MGTIIKDGVQYSGFGGQGAVIDDTVERVDTTWSSRKIAEEVGSCAKATSVYTKSQTYTKAEVDALIGGGGGLDGDSLITFTDSHGLFRYTTNYGASAAFKNGSLYNITGNILLKIDNNIVYNGGLDEVPYNELATGATQNNILSTGKYLWKEWVITYSASDGSYVEIPVKIAYIGQSLSNNLFNPYIHIVYPSDCGHEITFACVATNYTEVPSESGGGLQEFEYTISSPDSTSISAAIQDACIYFNGDVNITIDNKKKLHKVIARREFISNSSTRIAEDIYIVTNAYINNGNLEFCAVGGENYNSAGDDIIINKLIAKGTFHSILNTVEMAGTNPVVSSTDHSSTNVGDTESPWYVYDDNNNAIYKLVFVYG